MSLFPFSPFNNSVPSTNAYQKSDLAQPAIFEKQHKSVGKMEASKKDELHWFHKTIIYQVYPRSFQDSMGNGIGDIPGLTSRLDYFVDLGVETLWISPFYPSPQLDFGYDVSDFCGVDPLFGNLDDFDKLVTEAHLRGLKIVVDFVGGHSSHLHPWFQKSLKRESPYTDYYVWHDGKTDEEGNRTPPNNWLSVFSGSSWTWHEARQQYYYRPFIPEQPKLNYRSPELRQEIKDALKFWFDRGIDGMRLDAINELVECEDKSLDEPRDMSVNCPADEYEYLVHVHTCLQPGTFQVIKEWTSVMEEYTQRDGRHRFMIGETYLEPDLRNKYFHQSGIIPSNMDLVEQLATLGLSGENVKSLVDREYSNLPPGAWPTFVTGNHDRHRVADKFGSQYVDSLNTLLLTLKGTPTTYYGEELGMRGIQVDYQDTQDPFGKKVGPERYKIYSRDPCRSPMQWDASQNAGFSTTDKTWLPVHPDYTTRNVKEQLRCEGGSSLKLYRTLAHLRKEPAFMYGSLSYAFTDQDIFSYVREDKETATRFLVIINFGGETFSRPGAWSGQPVNSTHGEIKAASSNTDDRLYSAGSRVCLKNLVLKPGEAIVLLLD